MVLDSRDRLFGLGQEAALIADLREVEPRAVAHRGRCAALDQLRKDLAGFAMQAVRQQHPAAQHLGLVGMLRDAAEMLRHHQAGHRAEVVLLIELEQRVAVVRGLHRTGKCIRCCESRDRNNATKHATKRTPRIRLGRSAGVAPSRGSAEGASGVGHFHCHTFTSNSGCNFPVESLMRSSMYFGSVPLSILIVAPRR